MNDMSKRPFSEQTPLAKVGIVVIGALMAAAVLGVAVLVVGLIWRAAIGVWS